MFGNSLGGASPDSFTSLTINYCEPCHGPNSVDLPATAQRFVERDQVRSHRRLALCQIVLRRVKCPLRVQHIEKIAEAADVKLVGHLHGASIGGYCLCERALAHLFAGI